MANWIGSSRSNYFLVKDLAAFKAMVESQISELEVSGPEQSGERQGKVCLLISKGSDSGALPNTRWDDEKDEDVEIDLPSLIAPHLVEGEIVVLQEIGAEKLRYLTGYSIAFDHTGERVEVSLRDIYALAMAKFGRAPDEASY